MAFSKSFPKEEDIVKLSVHEEKEAEHECREENIRLMKECIDDAKKLIEEKGFKGFKEDILAVATKLFGKRASDISYWKENMVIKKFRSE